MIKNQREEGIKEKETVQYSTVQYRTVQFSTVQNSTEGNEFTRRGEKNKEGWEREEKKVDKRK